MEIMREGMDKSVNSTESNSSSVAHRKRRRKSSRRSLADNDSASDEDASAPFAELEPVEGERPPRTIQNSLSARRVSTRSSSRRHQQPSEDGLSQESDADVRVLDRRKSYVERNREDSAHSSMNSGRSLLEQLSAMAESPQEGEAKTPDEFIRKIRLFCGKIVEEPRVQLGIIFLIIVNAIIMGIATFDFVTDDPETDKAFEVTDRVFLVIFTVELVLQLVYRSLTFFTDAWLIFDFVIVVTSWSMESLQIVRAFRIFRAFRLVTRIGPLRELVMAIGAVMPRMYAIAMLLFLIFYIFAVLFTELFSDLILSDNYFGSLDMSLFTCMELMTLEWAGVVREVMEHEKYAWAPLLAFISVTGFIVFNLIVAVVCDAVAVVDREVQAEKHPEMLSDKDKLSEAQERIWELTETVEILMMRQERLLSVVDMLSKEVRTAVIDPVAAIPRNNPLLRSAMKNPHRDNQQFHASDSSRESGAATRPTQDNEMIEVLHFSDEDEGDTTKVHVPPVNHEKVLTNDAKLGEFDEDVHTAVDRVPGGKASPDDPAEGNDDKWPKSVKLNELGEKGQVNNLRGIFDNGKGPPPPVQSIQ